MIRPRAVPIEELTELALRQGTLFAVLDACDAPAVPVLAAGVGPERCVSLYRGDAEEIYADIAPYLLHVNDETLLQWILQYSRTQGWGILLSSTAPFDAVRRHLRQFLKVLGPDGKRLYFRFYDPQVLETFLPTCSPDQLGQLYRAVTWYGMLDEGKARAYELA